MSHLIIDMTINTRNPLYAGLGVEEVGGRANLPDAMTAETLNSVGKAVQRLVDDHPDRDLVVLTGPCAVQCYLVALHVVLHLFKEVQYRDGRGQTVIIAKHG